MSDDNYVDNGYSDEDFAGLEDLFDDASNEAASFTDGGEFFSHRENHCQNTVELSEKDTVPESLSQPNEKITGRTERVIWQSDDASFSVFRFVLEEGESTAATLNAPPPPLGQLVTLEGEWTIHPRFGKQFRAAFYRFVTPTDAEAIEKFLAAGLVAGIGPAVARRLVAKFGDETLDIISHHPKRLIEIAGIGKKTAEKIHESYARQVELKDIILWLEMHGISGSLAAKLYKVYGSLAVEVVEKNPYRVAQNISGLGFATADRIARSLGWPNESPERIKAGIDYALNNIAEKGHVCIIKEELVTTAAKLLAVPPSVVSDILALAKEDGIYPVEEIADYEYFYPPYLYEAESETAKRLVEIQEWAKPLSVESPAELVEEWEDKNNFSLSDGQREAMIAALTYGVFILTGGPGTGKTTVVRGMLELLKAKGLTVLLAAPTGRAAKRLAEAAGAPAVTLHRLLEASADPTEPLFGRDEDNPLEANAIIVDESSMIDIVLMRCLLAAVPSGCHIIFVGDVAQLPSVGPGSVLRDILRSKAVPTVLLTEIFRQAAESPIVLNAHAINHGREPKASRSLDDEFVFLPIEDERKTADVIISIVTEKLPEYGYDPLTDIEVLAPMHRGECGVEALNARLQAKLNPKRYGQREIRLGQFILREGDKVMQTRNDYEKDIFNGDIGHVISLQGEGEKIKKEVMQFETDVVKRGDETVYVAFDNDHLVKYEKGELKNLSLAYAMTVHKSQGSEYPVIVMPLVDSHYIMLQRTILYTAVTRAKSRVILIGSPRALYTAVINIRTARRYTLLTERLADALV